MSVIKQTMLPHKWIIVDDNSVDKTAEIVSKYAKTHQWISLIRNKKTVKRGQGGGGVRAFLYGFDSLDIFDWDFIVNLDGDLFIESKFFFEDILNEFSLDPKLGIAGGLLYALKNGKKIFEKKVDWHVRGATKIYRRECFIDIGRLVPQIGWDSIDEYTAMTKGCKTKTFHEYTKCHLEENGTKKEAGGRIDIFRRSALSCYNSGQHPLYVAARGVYSLKNKPYVLGSLYFFLHYLIQQIKANPILVDNKTKKYIRRMNLKILASKLRVIVKCCNIR
jgi:glycosyltransferase involved in cell wall biosynthesis